MSPRLRRRIAHFNRRFTNPVLRPLAARLPGFGVVVHAGRKSGREYRTPVNVFRDADGYVIALTYGTESDWVRNVLAAGGCALVRRGRRTQLTAPALFHDESRRPVPRLVRPMLRLLGVADFMRVRLDTSAPKS
ncbi:MAG TPA: nitroreductase family deazaflavin-dependent oxidoreductase [Gaiellaceae bacterium]|jgi:deazaflavin-dependent oxidoreductase (nitroreductase family)